MKYMLSLILLLSFTVPTMSQSCGFPMHWARNMHKQQPEFKVDDQTIKNLRELYRAILEITRPEFEEVNTERNWILPKNPKYDNKIEIQFSKSIDYALIEFYIRPYHGSYEPLEMGDGRVIRHEHYDPEKESYHFWANK